MKWYFVVGFTILVMFTTIAIRIPVPGGGYFNLGDVLIVFCGLYTGKTTGLIAGGIGSALADLVGFPIFAPITLVAKGLLGLFSGFGHGKSKLPSILFPLLGAILMVIVYFAGTWLMPAFGQAVALADLVPNIIQASLGLLGGRLLYEAFVKLERVS
ncbi:MAG TPA: ECF transporter S component [Candidatus Cloacimonadota bacterium]|nr:ECF transporter S component [Candidatus Cloacimonadota bacterium]